MAVDRALACHAASVWLSRRQAGRTVAARGPDRRIDSCAADNRSGRVVCYSPIALPASFARPRRLRGSWSTIRSSIRIHAALIAVALVVSSVLGVIHEAATRHVVCAQHGELVHAGAAQPGDRALTRTASVRQGGAPAVQGHDHCAMAQVLRDPRIASRPSLLELAPAAVAQLAAPGVDGGDVDDRGVYRTAPKTSPPA